MCIKSAEAQDWTTWLPPFEGPDGGTFMWVINEEDPEFYGGQIDECVCKPKTSKKDKKN